MAYRSSTPRRFDERAIQSDMPYSLRVPLNSDAECLVCTLDSLNQIVVVRICADFQTPSIGDALMMGGIGNYICSHNGMEPTAFNH